MASHVATGASSRRLTGGADRQIVAVLPSGDPACCHQMIVLEPAGDEWLQTPVGVWRHEFPDLPRDVDGDGAMEFLYPDQRFVGVFGSYATSWTPPRYLSYAEGEVADVSDAPRYRRVYLDYFEEMRSLCGDSGNGACAAMAAASTRLGLFEAAWPEVLDRHDPALDWDYDPPCGGSGMDAVDCSVGSRARVPGFPGALRRFLVQTGYLDSETPGWPQDVGPAFDCSAGRQRVERWICDSVSLSALDRALAVAWTRALASSADPESLRAGQRAFLQRRDGSGSPEAVGRLYRRRILDLQAAAL